MKTFKVVEDWCIFKNFINANLKHIYQKRIGFMHRKDEIYIRSYDESILDIIRKKYSLTPCDQPKIILDPRGWEFMGNEQLFDLIP